MGKTISPYRFNNPYAVVFFLKLILTTRKKHNKRKYNKRKHNKRKHNKRKQNKRRHNKRKHNKRKRNKRKRKSCKDHVVRNEDLLVGITSCGAECHRGGSKRQGQERWTGNSGRDQQISTGHAFCTKTKITRSSGRSTTTAIRQRHRGTFEAHRGTFEGHRGTFEG